MSEHDELVKRLKDRAELLRKMDEVAKPRQVTKATQDALREAAQAIERLEGALEKINGIRNSVVGAQNMNFSEHVYPLVAALEEAGYEGLDYAENRKNLGTLIERAETAEQQLAEARAALTQIAEGGFSGPTGGAAASQIAREALAAPAPGKDSEGKE